ncbi:MAG TPA: MBL fold metallo-hydrolase [Thermomicrobiaceae bacterium]|nr:MBL fold metallo-hydrolase [Thermomicrobiaceae bacterium]
MDVTFLGTGAAEGYPNPFCACDHCRRARELGGRSLRTRSAALVGNDLLIDLGPDLIAAAALHGRPLAHVRYCLQTHAHADHLDASLLLARSPEYGVSNAPRLHLYASTATLARVGELLAADLAPRTLFDPESGARLNLAIRPVEPLERFQAGPYRVTALPANHGAAGAALLFAIEGDARTVLYATDTAGFLDEVWDAFHRFALRFDVVILDHTYGDVPGGDDHLNARGFVEHVARLRGERLLTDGGRVLATHVSPATNPPHPEFAAMASERGYEVAHDGLTV